MKGEEKKGLIIAIDGPSGAGKSTVGRALARRLEYIYIDTGAMYRAVALKAKEGLMRMDDEIGLSKLASHIQIVFKKIGERIHTLCDGEDITDEIRSQEISQLASEISKQRGIREVLVQKQREMGKGGGVVLEGRDTGTVVFPDADIKFYLDADPRERGKRRFKELLEKGIEANLDEIIEEVKRRDDNDMRRAISPLKKAEDSIFIDSTNKTVEEVVEEMYKKVKEKMRGL